MIAIIDYNAGNVLSVQNMLRKLGGEAIITNDITQIEAADKLILPGVGSFDYGMSQLNSSGLLDVLKNEVIIKSKPILGICLGAQLMTQSSEEGTLKGLGWFNTRTVRFNKDEASAKSLTVPHIGWTNVTFRNNNPLINKLSFDEPRYYFVHSYHFSSDHEDEVFGEADYIYRFPCALHSKNIYGVQFHPEKSHKYGMELLSNFLVLS